MVILHIIFPWFAKIYTNISKDLGDVILDTLYFWEMWHCIEIHGRAEGVERVQRKCRRWVFIDGEKVCNISGIQASMD